MRADLESQLFLKAVAGGEVVGSVRACREGGTCFIGRLVVRPDCQGRGIGTRLMDEIEARCAEAERFELFTGHRSDTALHIYAKRGYAVVRKEPVHARLTLVYLVKARA